MKWIDYFKKKKLSSELIWNYSGVIFVGAAGMMSNLIIFLFYDIEIFGGFSQILALYFIISQISTVGVNLSLIHFIPINKKIKIEILSSAISVSFLFSFLISNTIFFFEDFIYSFFESDYLKSSFMYCLIGIPFNSMNKNILAYFNGIGNFKEFSIIQMIRSIVILVFFLIFILCDFNSAFLTLFFPFSEIAALTFVVFRYDIFSKFKISRSWMIDLTQFGLKVSASHILTDINTKIDVIILGYFTSDVKVGIYSIASIIIDGIKMILHALKNYMNPILSKIYQRRNENLFQRFYKFSSKKILQLTIFLGLILSLSLLLISIFDKSFSDPFYIFLILFVGVIFSSKVIPFEMIFNQFGMPATQTLFLFYNTLANVILSLIFIQKYGMWGVAIGTAISSGLSVVIFKILKKFYLFK